MTAYNYTLDNRIMFILLDNYIKFLDIARQEKISI